MTPRCNTRTWTPADIDSAIAKALIKETCPRCPSMMDEALDRAPSVIETVGQWTLSVGRSDVIVTVPVVCHVHLHRFILRVDLWRRARTPIGGLKVKSKLVFKDPQRPRPLAGI